MTSSPLILSAPLAGWSTPLAEAPDEVFSTCLLGDGVAIDPTGATLHAPCDAVVGVLPASRHAVTLAAGGHEILLHVGIDTVALNGEGFTAHVTVGDRVSTGQPLISFDLDLLARRAKSVLTPVLILDGQAAQLTRRSLSRELAVGDFLLEVTARAGGTAAAASAGGEAVSREITVTLVHGIHARPAALLAGALRRFAAEVSVAAHGRAANARSPVALMSLSITHGDAIRIQAQGPDATEALAAFEEALRQGAAAEKTAGRPTRAQPRPAPPPGPRDAMDGSGPLRGVVASPGLALGPAVRLDQTREAPAEEGRGVSAERHALAQALEVVRGHLAQRARGSGTAGEIAAAHEALLADPTLQGRAQALISAGRSAGHAWQRAIEAATQVLAALPDERLRARVDDLTDLDGQVQEALARGQGAPRAPLPAGGIVLARELLPSQMAWLTESGVAGFCLEGGGPTSHVSLLAQAAGLPALVAAGPRVLTVAPGTPLVLDAEAGVLEVDPGEARTAAVRARLTQAAARAAARMAAAAQPGRTAEGTRIGVRANIGSLGEARQAAAGGAEGCGLLRTELLFLDRDTPPGFEEQRATYQGLADALAGLPLTIRTLDIGGDKPIPYLPLPHEDNPALGLRGVRTSLWRPDLLATQLAAILAVEPPGQCRILLPMITEPEEVRTVRGLIEAARTAAGRPAPIEVGVMIETPAAALLADRLAAGADFFSIGTNDLTQYTLAMDRGHPALAARIDGLHPAVLRLIAATATSGAAAGRPVAVCGGLASDPAAVPVLLGLGVTELSVVPAFIPHLKALLSGLPLADCAALAQAALTAASATEVRALAAAFLAQHPGSAP